MKRMSATGNEPSRGHLFIIGGGERPGYLMRAYVNCARGTNVPVLIVPFASRKPAVQAERLRAEFAELGYRDIVVATVVDAPGVVKYARAAGAVYFAGGDQNRLRDVMTGTPLLEAIRQAYGRGAVIGGTSAGAAVMGSVMLSGNELLNPAAISSDKGDAINAFTWIRRRNIETTEGFGFLERCVVDQHFVHRKRHNRLLSVVLEHPELLGIGIDESTAIIVSGEHFDVIGESCVVVFDASKATGIGTGTNDTLCCERMLLHLLVAGQRFDLVRRRVMTVQS